MRGRHAPSVTTEQSAFAKRRMTPERSAAATLTMHPETINTVLPRLRPRTVSPAKNGIPNPETTTSGPDTTTQAQAGSSPKTRRGSGEVELTSTSMLATTRSASLIHSDCNQEQLGICPIPHMGRRRIPGLICRRAALFLFHVSSITGIKEGPDGQVGSGNHGKR